MKFYLQLGEDNRITDIIQYPYDSYVEVEIPLPLPPKATSGCYQLVDGVMVYRADWDNDLIMLDKLTNAINQIRECQTIEEVRLIIEQLDSEM